MYILIGTTHYLDGITFSTNYRTSSAYYQDLQTEGHTSSI